MRYLKLNKYECSQFIRILKEKAISSSFRSNFQNEIIYEKYMQYLK
jgi:hypothetical protein